MSNPTLYINKINDSILFDEKNKEFTICDGSRLLHCEKVFNQFSIYRLGN